VKEVVDHEQGTLGEQRLSQVEVLATLALGGVDEEQVEGPGQAGNGLARIPLDELDALRHARPVP
jgi:hypothetical protein